MPTRIFHKNTSHERLSPFHNGDNQHVNQDRRQDLAAGGAKNQKGAHIFKMRYWMYGATRGQTWNGRNSLQMVGPGTTGPPLATTLMWREIIHGH